MRPEKGYAVEELGSHMDRSSSLILTTFTGLNSTRIGQLRRLVRERAGRYVVVKNTIFGIAAKKRGLDTLCPMLKGQVGVVFGEDDSLELLKAVVKFGKENEELKVLGGVLDGEVRSGKEILAITTLPPKSVVAAELVGAIGSPLSEFVHLLGELPRSLVFILNSIQEKSATVAPEEGN